MADVFYGEPLHAVVGATHSTTGEDTSVPLCKSLLQNTELCSAKAQNNSLLIFKLHDRYKYLIPSKFYKIYENPEVQEHCVNPDLLTC